MLEDFAPHFLPPAAAGHQNLIVLEDFAPHFLPPAAAGHQNLLMA